MPASSTYDSGTMVTNPNIPQSVQHSAMDHDKTYSLALEISSLMHQQQLQQQHQQHQQQQHHQQQHPNVDFLSVFSHLDENNPLVSSLTEAERRRSQNMTECVAVPSSEHVAEIVGRQGCKIKALRAKTNTYIKTPVRGEEPVFVVTGRKEDVANAKREILSAAEHFSQIRACRKNNINGSMAPGPPANVPGQLTINVTVPYRVVGLVVGPKGATIKRIQQTTQTYIVTPSRDKDPIFEVTGLPDAVEAAKREIESHIAMRTGSMMDDDSSVASFDTLGNSADFYTALYNSTKPSLNAASLNALLSSNSGYQQNVLGNVNSPYSMFNGHSQPTVSNGHASMSSGVTSNGLSGLGSNYSTIGSNVGSMMGNGLSSNSHTLADLSSFNGLGSSAGSSKLLSNGSAHSYHSGNSSAGSHSTFGSSSNAFSFNLLGENANNILNSKSSGLNNVSSPANLLSSFGNVSSLASGNSALQSMYGLDEGLGSLGSSMGSSPALDQTQFSQNIWSDAKYQLPPVSNFNGRPFGCASGSASRPLSPTRALNHGSVQRSNSDPTPKLDVLSSAIKELSVTGGLRCSNASSPDALPDYDSTPFATVPGFSNSSPIRRSPVYELMSMVPGASSTASVLDSLSSASVVPPVLAASAASAIPIGTPASSSALGTVSSPNQSGSASGSRRSSVDVALGAKICPTCKGDTFEVAFVPCGHRRFCLPCAQKIQDATGCCPSCHAESKEVIRIRDDHE